MEVICGREDKDRGWERAKRKSVKDENLWCGCPEHGGSRLLRNVVTSLPNYESTHATK
jgi:hypothetical protein